MTESGSLRTDEIACAVYLIVQGCNYNILQRSIGRGRGGVPVRKCVWVFDKTDESQKLMANYKAGRGLVEPNRFARTWGVVRREMINFLDV